LGTEIQSLRGADTVREPATHEQGREIIETLYPHRPRLEMFAQQHRAGWEVWGNEVDWEEDE